MPDSGTIHPDHEPSSPIQAPSWEVVVAELISHKEDVAPKNRMKTNAPPPKFDQAEPPGRCGVEAFGCVARDASRAFATRSRSACVRPGLATVRRWFLAWMPG